MYLQDAINKKRQFVRPSANFATIPAPVLGWNVRDSLEAMDPGFATILTNYIPRTGYAELRQGITEHADTGETADVEFLHEFRGASRVLLAAAADKVFNVTTSTPATLGSGFTSSQWVGENFNNRTFMVNGVDIGQVYDGTTLEAMTFTFDVAGPTATLADLNYVHQTKRRLFFAQNGLGGFWYGPVDGISGELAYFDLSFVAPGSGILRAIGSVTVDSGAGLDDIVAFIMDSGDVLLYKGIDPATAADWELIGRYRVGEPIGHKPIVPFGPDLLMITPAGFTPILSAIRAGLDISVATISDTIIGAVKDATDLYKNNFGWNIQVYPAEQLLIFNIPTGSQCIQFVMSTATKAWCQFSGFGSKSSSLLNNELYTGCVGGKVMKYGGGSDDGVAIKGDGQTAWSDFGRQGLNKHFVMYRPIMSSDGTLDVAMGLGVDFKDAVVSQTAPTQTDPAGQWGTGLWGSALWGGGQKFIRAWRGTNTRGDHAAVRINTETTGQRIRWYSTDVQFIPSGPR